MSNNQDDEYQQNLEDDLFIEAPKTRVLGNALGVGTFIIFVFFGIFMLVWLFSFSCAPVVKSLSRAIAFLILLITLLVIVLAPREERYTSTRLEPNVSIFFFFRDHNRFYFLFIYL